MTNYTPNTYFSNTDNKGLGPKACDVSLDMRIISHSAWLALIHCYIKKNDQEKNVLATQNPGLYKKVLKEKTATFKRY